MTYDANTPNTGTTPLSGGIGIDVGRPEHGSYVRLAPSADAVRDLDVGQLQVGDLILSTTTDLDSAAIRTFTDSPVSHISIYVGEGMVVEAIGSGVTAHPVATALADDYYAAAYRKTGLTNDDRDMLARWLNTQVGRPYDVGGLLSEHTNTEDAWFCSELVFAAFAHIGKPLSTTPPHDSQPGYVLTMTGVDYLGHLKRPGMAAAQSGGGSRNDEPGRFAPTVSDRDAMITPGYAGMTFDATQLVVGDIVVTSADSAISQAIRSRTGQAGSHAALYVGDGMVIEAVTDGVTRNTLSYTLGQTDFAAAYRMPGLSPANRTQIKAFADGAVAREVGYDFRAIATLQNWQDPDRLFCSELVFEAFASAGKPLGNAGQSTPGQITTLSGIEYLGHLPARRDGHTSSSRSLASTTETSPVIQAAIDAGATEAEARAYFGHSMARPMSGSTISLPDVGFLSDSSALMAGVRTVVDAAFPADANPLDILFDYCTRHNMCLAIGLHGSVPSGWFSNAGISGGIVVAPNRRAGLYFSSSYGEGWVFDAAVGVQIIVVFGGESNFNGTSLVVGGSLDGSEGPGGGLRVITNTAGTVIGGVGEINFSLGIPVASAVEFTAAVSNTSSRMRSFSLSATDSPKLAEAIRMAIEFGATEEEARAFLTNEPQSSSMSYSRSLSTDTLPPYRPITGWKKRLIKRLIGITMQHIMPGSGDVLAKLARDNNISVGIGAGVGGGFLVAAGQSVGIVFLPNGDLATYGAFSWGGGYIFEVNATIELTVIQGDASVFYGNSLVIGGSVSLGAGVSVGLGARAILPDRNSAPIGFMLEVGVSAGIPLLDTVEFTIQHARTVPLSLPQSAPRMIGGLPLSAPSRGLSAPNVIPFSQPARSFSEDQDIDVKLRIFIPAPAIDAPPAWIIAGATRYYSGDGRGFQYSGGTSRAELHAKVRLTPGATSRAHLRTLSRKWGETKQYSAWDVSDTPGKPSWWHDVVGTPTPLDKATLRTIDANLNMMPEFNTGADDEVRVKFGRFSMHVDGGIPLMGAAAPNINARFDLYLRREIDGTLKAHLHGNHDGFPAYELYIDGDRIYEHDPVAQGESPTALFGTGDGEYTVKVPWREIRSTAVAQSLSRNRDRIWM